MSLEEWFFEYDQIDERYAAILEDLKKERKILKRHLATYPDSDKNGSLDADKVISAIDKMTPEINRSGLIDILADYWTPGGEGHEMMQEIAQVFSKKGLDFKHQRSRTAKQYCCDRAAEIWEEAPVRIGEVTSILSNELIARKLFCPQDEKVINKWLKDCEKSGELTIPPKATQPGRPKKN